MTHVQVTLYTVRPSSIGKTLKRSARSLARLLQKQPGFISYEIIQAGETKAITISKWQTSEAADAAIAVASKWIRENASQSVLLVEDYVGEVQYTANN